MKDEINEGWESELDQSQHILKVHDKTTKEILSDDFVMAKLDKKEQEYILETISNAEFAKETIESINNVIDNEIKQLGITRLIPEKTKKKIIEKLKKDRELVKENAKEAYRKLILKIKGLAVLKRNMPNNNLIELVLKREKEQIKEEEEEEKVKRKIKKRHKKEEDEDEEEED